ncbi:MAG: hypothetical protein ABI411_06110 [Tahibacter sp.]
MSFALLAYVFGDLLLTVPLVYCWINRRAGRTAWVGAAALCAWGIWIGAWLMPDEPFLQNATSLRWIAASVVLAFELALIISLLRVLPRLGRSDNPETLLLGRMAAHFGKQPFVPFIQWEARMWLHLLAPSGWRWHFAGTHHYSYHRKDANASDQLGIIALMLVSLPIDHLLLMLWSPLAAWILTALTAYATCGCVAHYRAIHRRPISLEAHRLCLRNGLATDVSIDLSCIAAVVHQHAEVARREVGALRLGAGNRPNVCLHLREEQALPRPVGTSVRAGTVYFSVDEPASLIAELRSRITAPATAFGITS